MSVLFFLVAVVVLIFAVSGVRPPLTHRSAVFRPPWMQVMIVNEFAPTWLAAAVLGTTAGWALGVQDDPIGVAGMVAVALALALFAVMILRSVRSLRVMRAGLTGVTDVPRPRYALRDLVFPYPYREFGDVDRVDDIEYAPGLQLDLYRGSTATRDPAPLLIHVHGGSWGGGHRRQQAQPLIREMARRGWLVAAIDYPLVPEATFPDQVIAIHGALRWFRDRADDLGIDPGSIVLTGGSAGAHLASLVALTDADGAWSQRHSHEPPVAAGVMYYGVYDLLDRHGIRDVWPILSLALIKADPVAEPEKFHRGSPIDHVGDGAPPMLVVHGAADSLVPIAESEHFVEALEDGSGSSVVFIPLPGATHAFDAVPSIRTQNVVAGTAAWLEAIIGS